MKKVNIGAVVYLTYIRYWLLFLEDDGGRYHPTEHRIEGRENVEVKLVNDKSLRYGPLSLFYLDFLQVDLLPLTLDVYFDLVSDICCHLYFI